MRQIKYFPRKPESRHLQLPKTLFFLAGCCAENCSSLSFWFYEVWVGLGRTRGSCCSNGSPGCSSSSGDHMADPGSFLFCRRCARVAHVACPPEQPLVGRKVAGGREPGENCAEPLRAIYYFAVIMELHAAGAPDADGLGCNFRHPTGAHRQVRAVIAPQQHVNCLWRLPWWRLPRCKFLQQRVQKTREIFLCCKVLQVLWEGSGVFLFCRLQVLEATAAIDGQKLILLLPSQMLHHSCGLSGQ